MMIVSDLNPKILVKTMPTSQEIRFLKLPSNYTHRRNISEGGEGESLTPLLIYEVKNIQHMKLLKENLAV